MAIAEWYCEVVMTSNAKITIAVSARALFDFEDENHVFLEGNPAAYCAVQAARLDVPAGPGGSFPACPETSSLQQKRGGGG